MEGGPFFEKKKKSGRHITHKLEVKKQLLGLVIIFQGVDTLKVIKNAKIPIFLSFFASCNSVSSCIIDCVDIFLQQCFYITNFQGNETLKST